MKTEIIYAFIDSQNLNLGTKSQGWNIDFKRFKVLLKDKYKIEKAFLFIGYVPGNESLYTYLQEAGFTCIFKPTMELPNGKVKGNVDAELVLHTMIEYPNFNKAMVVSGDGDFYCLVEYLLKKQKLGFLFVPNRKKYSAFLKHKDFLPYTRYVGDFENKIKKRSPHEDKTS